MMIIKWLLWALVKLVCSRFLAQCLAHTFPIDGMCSYVIFVPQITVQGGYHYCAFTQGLSDFSRTVETVVGRKEYLQVKVKVIQSCLTLCNPMDYTVHEILQARILGWVIFPFSKGSSQPQTMSPTLQGDSLPAGPKGKPKNTGMGSPSLLQQIFLT